MYYPYIKETAKKMRQNGASLNDIVDKFGITKSTASFWCKDIILTESSILKINTKGKEKSVRGLLRYSEKKRKERIERNILQKRDGSFMVGDLTDRDILMIGLGLYWGEGYKYENCEFGFTNSNPKMIRFYFKWLKLLDIDKNSLIFRLTLNEFFRKEENLIKSFWINFLGIEKEQFSKTTFIKTKLKKGSIKNVEKYKGILRVKVKKGTSLRNKILGSIEHISDS
ncbi:MAG: hypothetical protein NDI62_02745 [Burkholderiales bacterium]|nr:hypothetical protein [Burkholderiales bacterium]